MEARDRETECLRIARQARLAGAKSIGLFPLAAPVDEDLRMVAEPLARALATLAGAPVAVFDAWPAWCAPDGPARSEPAIHIRRQDDQLTFLTLRPTSDALTAATVLADATAVARQSFAHVLVDMTGLSLGHRATFSCAEMLVLMLRPGAMRDRELLAARGQVPDEQFLGVVLTD